MIAPGIGDPQDSGIIAMADAHTPDEFFETVSHPPPEQPGGCAATVRA